MTLDQMEAGPAVAGFSDDEARWQAVMARDTAADGSFVYAVPSTGIYCRPTCPSKRPRRDGVQFFASTESAEKAGFRPCLRCKPREASDSAQAVLLACRFIEQNLDEAVDLATLSDHVGLSPHHLQRVFKRAMGVTPREYADARRLERFKSEVKNGAGVTAAMVEAGYGSTSRLYERTPGQLGMDPTDYRRGGDGIALSYATAGTALGRLLVAATARGVCKVCLGESDLELESDLRREFSSADVERDDSTLRPWVEAIVRHLAGQQPDLRLPLDVRATAFQRRVWQELQRIPYGETRTYAQVAAAIGSPGAVRGVGQACARNPVALVVPCHRVVQTGGGLGGYRWGVARKQALLERESRQPRG